MTKILEEALHRAGEAPEGTAARLLDAAEAVFAEVGFQAASMREIARRAGVPFGAMHYHWGSKQGLWRAVCRRLVGRSRETLLANLRPGSTPAETLDRMVDAFLEMLVTHRNHTRLVCRTFLDDPQDPEVREMARIELNDLGLGIFRDLLPDAPVEPRLAVFLVATAFVACVTHESGQKEFLDGDVFDSPAARERLRHGLRHLARATFGVREGASS